MLNIFLFIKNIKILLNTVYVNTAIKNGHMSCVIVSNLDTCQVNNNFHLTYGHAHMYNCITLWCPFSFFLNMYNNTMFLRNVCSYSNISLFHHLQRAISLFRLSAAPVNRNTKYGTCIMSIMYVLNVHYMMICVLISTLIF